LAAGQSSTRWIDRPFANSTVGLDGDPRRAVEFADKFFQQTKEQCPFLSREWRQDVHLCPARGLGEPFEHGLPGGRERKIAPPPIMRSSAAVPPAPGFA
jgi:hypothetical protein